jgi:hypothetical protein
VWGTGNATHWLRSNLRSCVRGWRFALGPFGRCFCGAVDTHRFGAHHPCMKNPLPTAMRAAAFLISSLGLALALLAVAAPASASNNPIPGMPEYPVMRGADAVVLFTAAEDRAVNIGTDPITPYVGTVQMLTPGIPQDVVIALSKGSFTGGYVRGRTYKMYLISQPSGAYYTPVYTVSSNPKTVANYRGQWLDIQLDFQVQQFNPFQQPQQTSPLSALTLADGPRDLQLFARMKGTYAFTALDMYLLVVPPAQPLGALLRAGGTDTAPQYVMTGDVVPLLRNVALGPDKEVTVGAVQALQQPAPHALTYRIDAGSVEGLYHFYAVVVDAGMSPTDPSNWLQVRTSVVHVAR